MNDAFVEAFQSRLIRLPAVTELTLSITPNTDVEHLSCIVCGFGADEKLQPPEWLCLTRGDGSHYVHGLHEKCRSKSQVKEKP